MSDIAITWVKPGNPSAMLEAAHVLPTPLDDRQMLRLQLDLQFQHALLARGPRGPLGFVTFFLADGSAHLGWAVVTTLGVGLRVQTLLFERLCRDLGRLGVYDICRDDSARRGHGGSDLVAVA